MCGGLERFGMGGGREHERTEHQKIMGRVF